MKNILNFVLALIVFQNTFGQTTINLSTGIDNSNKYLTIGSQDPYWKVNGNQARLCTAHPAWQPNPISGNYSPSFLDNTTKTTILANWINSTGLVDNEPDSVYTYERKFTVNSTSNMFKLELSYLYTVDDVINSIILISPSGVSHNVAGQLFTENYRYDRSSINVWSHNSSESGIWKIRINMTVISQIGALNFSGFVKYSPLPDPCCKNEFSVVTPSEVPPNFSDGSGFTYSVEDYNVNIPNTIPITEIRVNVEGFELISKYDDCLKCYNPPTTLGSMVGLWNIGSGANTLYNQNLFPNDWLNSLTGNPNEAIWSNPRGVMLNRNDLFKLIYIFPESSNIPCCVDSAKICLRIAYTDVNCGRCEVTTCSIVPLTNLEKESAEQAGNGKGRVKATMSLKDLLLSSNSN